MVTLVIPFAGAGGKTRLSTTSPRGARRARGRDARGRARGGRGRRPERDVAGSTRRRSGSRGRGRACRRRTARSSSSTPTSRASCREDLRGARRTPRPRSSLPRDGTTNALSLRRPTHFAPLYGPGSADRFARTPSRGPTRRLPNLADDVDTMDDLARLELRVGPHTRAGARASSREPRVNVVVLSGGVGGARFVRGVVAVAGAAATTVIGNVGDDVEVLGLHVSPDLDSILYALAGLADEERGWGRARRDLARARDGARARRGGLVRARRPRPRPPPRPHAGAAERASRSRRSPRGSRRRSASRRASCRRPTTGCARGSTRRPGSFPFQEWFVARGHRDEVDALRFEGAEAARPAPGALEALAAARSDPRRAEQSLRLDPPDPRGRRAARRARVSAACRASP